METYDELIKRLREDVPTALANCDFDFVEGWAKEAADAIEELSEQLLEMGQVGKFLLDVHKINSKMATLESVLIDSEWLSHYKALLEVLYLPKWIPINERLPKEMDKSRDEWSAKVRPSNDVLVWLSSEKRQTVAWYSYVYNTWTTIDENTEYYSEEVSHWLPLPEPPKEGS